MIFRSGRTLRARAHATFRKYRRRLARLLPDADIQHIGSTAVPGAITRGDIDIVVRVTAATFARANQVLAAHYRRNTKSLRSRSFASFEDLEGPLPLGIQLVVRESAQDHFVQFRDRLIANPRLVSRYNQLKQRCIGRTMAEYRRRKSAFIHRVLATRLH